MQWASSDDPDVLSLLVEMSTQRPDVFSVDVTYEMARDLQFKLFKATLSGEPARSGHFGLSSYDVARHIYSWFVSATAKEPRETEALVRAAAGDLAEMYRTSSEESRRCIVDDILEHLFELPPAKAYFASWKDDGSLSQAWHEAEAWASDQ